MLSKRIAGILKQYPNPEVAFFATEVLLENALSPYLTSGLQRPRRSKRRSSEAKQYDILTLTRGRPGDRYLLFSASDPIEKLKQTKWRFVSSSYLGEGGEDACLSGRELLQRDLTKVEPLTPLKEHIQNWLNTGEWYDGKSLNQNYRTEVMSTWVASWVNRWLKAFSKLTTLGELVDHYDSILKIARDIGDVCDYVSEERIDPAHLTFNQLLHRSRRWHAAQRRDMMAAAAPPSERVYDRDNYGIFKLTTREALEHEGNFMGHCVGRYWKDVHDGKCEIYSVRNLEGKSVATIEVRPPDRSLGYRLSNVVQIKGPANRAVKKPAELCDTIYYFLESIGARNNTGSCMAPTEARENPEWDDEWDDELDDEDERENPGDEFFVVNATDRLALTAGAATRGPRWKWEGPFAAAVLFDSEEDALAALATIPKADRRRWRVVNREELAALLEHGRENPSRQPLSTAARYYKSVFGLSDEYAEILAKLPKAESRDIENLVVSYAEEHRVNLDTPFARAFLESLLDYHRKNPRRRRRSW